MNSLLKKMLFPLLTLLVILGMKNLGKYADIADHVYLYVLPAVGAVSFYLSKSKYETIVQGALVLGISSLHSGDFVIITATYLLVLSLYLAIALKKRYSHFKTLMIGFILLSIAMGIRILIIENMYQTDIWISFIEYLKSAEVQLPKNLPLNISTSDMEARKLFLTELIEMTAPVLYIIAISFCIIVNDFIATLILVILRKPVVKFNRFFLYGIDPEQNKALSYLLILSYISVYLFEIGGEILIVNMLLLLFFVFIVYGFACISYIMTILRFHFVLKLFLYGIILKSALEVNSVLIFMIAFIGMADSLLGVRRRISQRIFGIKK